MQDAGLVRAQSVVHLRNLEQAIRRWSQILQVIAALFVAHATLSVMSGGWYGQQRQKMRPNKEDTTSID